VIQYRDLVIRRFSPMILSNVLASHLMYFDRNEHCKRLQPAQEYNNMDDDDYILSLFMFEVLISDLPHVGSQLHWLRRLLTLYYSSTYYGTGNLPVQDHRVELEGRPGRLPRMWVATKAVGVQPVCKVKAPNQVGPFGQKKIQDSKSHELSIDLNVGMQDSRSQSFNTELTPCARFAFAD